MPNKDDKFSLSYRKKDKKKKQQVDDFFLLSMKKRGIIFKNDIEIDGVKISGNLVVKTLEFVEKILFKNITTNLINDVVHNFTIKNNAIPGPLNYRGYPKSACVSVNEVVCHGIPNNITLKIGDLVNIDVTSIFNGYYADANKSFFIGNKYCKSKYVMKIARECLLIGMSLAKPGNSINHIGIAIQEHAEKNGCSVVREFVGHGVGINFHEIPQIPHYECLSDNFILQPRMVFTIEPMINFGKKEVRILSDNWTVTTIDNSISAQFEQTVLIMKNGVKSLTDYTL